MTASEKNRQENLGQSAENMPKISANELQNDNIDAENSSNEIPFSPSEATEEFSLPEGAPSFEIEEIGDSGEIDNSAEASDTTEVSASIGASNTAASSNSDEADMENTDGGPINFAITDDEFMARDIEAIQASMPEIDEENEEAPIFNTPTPVEIPEDTVDDKEPTDEISEKKAKDKPESDKKERPIDSRFDMLELFTFTLVIVLIVTSLFFRHSIVDGISMEKTLYDGEHVIISDFLYTPKRGDIIVFQDKSLANFGNPDLALPLVKRVIAVGGDTIIVTDDGKIYVNDELVEDVGSEEADYLAPYFSSNSPDFLYYPTPHNPEFIQCKVPEGEVFVMGDNRHNSTDSRRFGTIKEEAILGRVLFRFYPFDSFGKVD